MITSDYVTDIAVVVSHPQNLRLEKFTLVWIQADIRLRNCHMVT